MARKNLFHTLINESSLEVAGSSEASSAPPTRAVEGLRSSLQDLQKASAQNIPVDQIMDSFIHDRVDLNEGIEDLVASFEKDGQEVPIKIRIVSSDKPGSKPYEIVIGRRRLAAARALKWKNILGFVVELDDTAMLRALIAENSARLETSFIGKSQMAVLAVSQGHLQAEVGELLGISQSLVNYMLRVYGAVGPEIINAIGDAPGVGRRRWQALQKLIEARVESRSEIINLMHARLNDMGDSVEQIWQSANAPGSMTEGPMPASTKRFEVLYKALKEIDTPPAPPKAGKPEPSLYLDGQVQSLRKETEITIKGSTELMDYIEAQMPDIVEAFTASKIT